MKKPFSIVLALALALSLCIPALAANVTTDDSSKEVTATYVADSAIIYGVDISWGSMEFTYTSGSWNTTEHSYNANNETGAWTCDTGANIITVTNHSNAGIDVTPSWAADNGYAAVSMAFDSDTLSLATADNGSNGAAGTATTGKITVTPSGDLPKDTKGKIGTITLTISGQGDQGDEGNSAALAQKLEDDLNAGSMVTLTEDIAYDDAIRLEGNTASTLDLGGHYLNADVEINLSEGTTLNIKDSSTGGRVRHLRASSGYLAMWSGTVEDQVDVSGTASFNMNGGAVKGGVNIDGDSTVTINSGTIKSNTTAIRNTGGTFSINPSDYVDTTTHEVVANADGTYTVKAI